MLALWPRIGLLLAGAALLWWPLDYVVYADRPLAIEDYGQLRVMVTLLNVFAYGYSKTWIAKRWTVPSIVAFIIAESAAAGYSIRRLGGLEGPWFYYFYIFPVMTLLFFVPMRTRLVVLIVMCVSCFLGMLVGNWGGIHHEDFPATVTFLVFVVLLSAYLGHVTYKLFQSNFVLRRRLAAKRDELDGLARSLEARVAEQTDQLRRLAQRLESVREAERRTVAREIHDHLGQMLTAIRYGLTFAKGRVRTAPEAAEIALEEVQALATQTSRTVRHLLAMLHPRVLEGLGLFQATRWLVAEQTKHSSLRTEVILVGEDEALSPEVATVAFRTLQEGITNVLEHAAASTLTVELRLTEEHLDLAIRDDGVGPKEGQESWGLGLVGVRERVHTLAGSVSWSRRPEGGFELLTRLPLQGAEH